MVRIIWSVLILAAVVALAPPAQAANIWITPDTTYIERDTSLVLTVWCDGAITGVKGFHFDFDMNDGGVVVAPSDDPPVKAVTLGDLFVENDTVTYLWNYLWTDLTRLTVDVLVLADSQTVSGPGELLKIRMNTLRFGSTDVVISGLKLRDRFNQPIAATAEGCWIKVCQFVGDVNGDNRLLVNDLTYLVNFMWKGGPSPIPYAAGDLDCSGQVNVTDVVLLTRYLFYGQPIPCGLCL